MKYFYLSLIILLTSCAVQKKVLTPKQEILNFQEEQNALYKNKKESPLRGNYFNNFKEHPFFPINLEYRVEADFKRIKNAKPFQMATSSGKTKTYEAYAKATFSIHGKEHSLTIYQSHRLRALEEYKDHLFLPFYDETNNIETYGGGRYIDVKIPKGDKIIIDFNQAYQPYCAYNPYGYSCPIVPAENRLNIRIPAGVQYNKEEFKH